MEETFSSTQNFSSPPSISLQCTKASILLYENRSAQLKEEWLSFMEKAEQTSLSEASP